MTDTGGVAAPIAPPKPRTGLDVAAIQGRQNLGLAIPAGVAAAVIGAIIWALSVYLMHMKLGLVALGVGILVGYAIRRTGQGIDRVFGYLGAACAAFGWALGTVLCALAFVAQNVGESITTVLARLGPGELLAAAIRGADAMDLLFLGIAVWEGYRYAFKYRIKKP